MLVTPSGRSSVRFIVAIALSVALSLLAGISIGQGSPIFVIAMLSGAALVTIVRYPRLWLMLAISLTAFRNYDNTLFGGILSWSNVLMLVMLVAYGVRMALRQTQLHIFKDWLPPLIGIVLWSWLSLLWTFNVSTAIQVPLSLLSLSVLQSLIYTVFRNNFNAVEWSVYAFIGSMSLFGLAATFSVFVAPDSEFAVSLMGYRIYNSSFEQLTTGRFAGFYADPNATALLLTYAILLAVSLAKVHQRFAKYLLWSIATLLLLPLIITYSRTGLIIFFAGMTYLLFRGAGNFRLVLVLGAAVGIAFVFQEGINTRFAELSDTSWGTRYLEIEAGLAEFINAPITGIGIEAFRPKLLASNTRLFQGDTPVIHNTYLKFLVELGLPGFLLLMWFCKTIVVRFRRNFNLLDKTTSPKLYWMNTGLAACFLSTAIFAIPLGVISFNTFWILLGILAVTSKAIEDISHNVLLYSH